MAYLQEIELDWNTFKVVRATLNSSTLYYLQYDLQYVPFVVEEGTSPMVAQSIYYCGVNRDPQAASGQYAALTSGVKASATIQGIVYTATSYGASSVTIQYADMASDASGTFTVVDYTALSGVVASVNGVALTEGIQWTAAVSNGATATSLASAITTATATTLSTGSAVGNVVTVSANTTGAAGNLITISSSNPVNLAVSGATLTGGIDSQPGHEFVTVNGNAITVHIDSGPNGSIAQQVYAAVAAWNAYNGNATYNSQAAAYLVSAVILPGQEGRIQVAQGPTPLAGGTAAVTNLSDWETNYKSLGTHVSSFSQGVGLEL